uniref:G_PROTEIN_RECEP_F1_2 domain-containing protein n=1 Tax=Heterorhabditis bacteriophora TaxID=37862 RepID=A0A1I7WMX5_HETBA
MSNCSSIQEMAFETVDLSATRALFSVLYCLVWIGAIVGNTLVLYVVTFNQISLSVRSVFIGCLAVSDLLMSLTSLPWTAVSIFTREWIFPGLICKLIGVFQVIGYNRAILIVVGIWVLGYSLALPVGIYSRAVSYENVCGVFCEEIW